MISRLALSMSLGSPTMAIPSEPPVNTVIANPAPPDPATSWSNDFEAVPNGTLLTAIDAAGWLNRHGATNLTVNGGKISTAGEANGISVRNTGVAAHSVLAGDFEGAGAHPAVIMAVGVDPATSARIIAWADVGYGVLHIYGYNAAGTLVIDTHPALTGFTLPCDVLVQLQPSEDGGPVDQLRVSIPGTAVEHFFEVPSGMGLGTYAGISSDLRDGTVGALTIGGAASYPDMTISLAGLEADRRIGVSLAYWSDTDDEYEIQVRTVGGTVVTDWESCTVTNNSTPGSARLTSVTPVPPEYKGANLNAEWRRAGTAISRSAAIYIPDVLSIGQNVGAYGGMQAPWAVIRAYQNMAVGGYFQDPNNSNALVPPGTPGLSDADGMPLASNLLFWFAGPNADGTAKTVEVTWTGGGTCTLQQIRCMHPTGHASLLASNAAFVDGYGNLTKTGPSGIQFTYTPTNELAGGEADANMVGFYIEFSGAPPKNINIHVVGEDTSQRFTPEYVTMMSQLRGPIRHMDSVDVNESYVQYNYGFAWSGRSRRSMIGLRGHPLGIPFEDLAELCWLTERDLHWNIPAGAGYSGSTGLDYVRKAIALMYAGTGSDISRNLSQKNLTTYAEVANETWNWGFDVFGLMDERGKAEGRIPDNPTNFWGRDAEQNYLHNTIMPVVEEIVPPQHLRRCLGVWFDHGPEQALGNELMNPGRGHYDPAETDPTGNSLWSTDHIDCVTYGMYVGGDPNGGDGGPTEQPASHSPADIAQWVKDGFEFRVPRLVEWNIYLRNLGIAPNCYEFGFSLGKIIGLTPTEERAARSSTVFKNAIRYCYDRLSQLTDGGLCIYSDYSVTADTGGINRWGHMASLNGDYNKMWEAVTEWQAAQA